MAILKDTWLLTTDESFKLVRSNLLKLVDELDFDPTLDGIAEALGFIDTKVDRHDGEIASLKWVLDLESIDELAEVPLVWNEEWPSKGYKLNRFANWHAISRIATEWFKKNQGSTTLPSEVKDEITKMATQLTRLSARNKKTKNFEVTRLLTNWFGAESKLSPYGQPLFSAVHPVGTTGETQSNVMPNWERLLTQVNLETAIEMARGMKDGNGTQVGFAARSYTLIVWPKLEKTARKILNDMAGAAAAVLDVEVANWVTINIFTVEWFKINLLVLPTLGQPSVKWKVGTWDEWFLLNQEWANEVEAFRFISGYDAIIDSYVDNKTKATIVDIDTYFAVDFYNPEVIIGSTWVNV